MADGVVNFWDPEAMVTGKGDPFLAKAEAHEGAVRAIDFNPTSAAGHLVATGARCVCVIHEGARAARPHCC
jgi:hypothetical protein